MLQNTITKFVCPFAMSGFAFAQTVTTSVAALTPLPCTVTVGAQQTTQSVPAGPLANTGWHIVTGASPAFESAQLSWQAAASTGDATFRVRMFTNLMSGSSARVGAGQIVVTFGGTGPAPMPVRYTGALRFVGGLSSLLGVDVGNDGTVDWTAGAGPLAGTGADIVAQPLQFRVLFDQSAQAPGTVDVELELRLVPDDGIHILPVATNCGINNSYTVSSRWDRSVADVELRAQHTAWHVLGFTSQPQLLPPALTMTGAPCLVVPSPDLVLRTGVWYLPIPAVLRPITLHAQLVDIVPAVRVSDAFLIVAL